MKVLNISRFLSIKGFPVMNDITIKIYANLRDQCGVESMFVMPLSHIPKWTIYLKNSLKSRYKIINNKNYIDKQYNIPIHFYESSLGFLSKAGRYKRFYDLKLQFPLYKKELYNHVKSFQPDIVHAHTLTDAFYAYNMYKKYNIPYIVTLRGSFYDLYKTKLMEKILINAKELVTPSASLKHDLSDLYNVELLAHGVDKEWYLGNTVKEFDKNTLRIITVASLIEMKNIQTVIKSVAKLINEVGYKIHYSIVGEGSYKAELKELVKKENIETFVTFHGFLSHESIRELYKKNDVFIMLSYPETFGRVYFEAAAQGLLIIGRKNTGMDGYFKDDEAFVIDANVDEVCKVLQRIDAPLLKKMTNKSKKRIKDFKNDRIIDRYNEILHSVALYSE